MDDLVQGELWIQVAAETYVDPVVGAEGTDILQADEAREDCVIADFEVLVEGEVACVKSKVRIEEKSHPFEERPLDPGSPAPKKAVVHKKDLGPRGDGPADGLGAGVHGEGDELHGSPLTPDLNAVEGIVDLHKLVDREERTAPEVEFLENHGREYIGQGGINKYDDSTDD
jgi:hypothetical protein